MCRKDGIHHFKIDGIFKLEVCSASVSESFKFWHHDLCQNVILQFYNFDRID